MYLCYSAKLAVLCELINLDILVKVKVNGSEAAPVFKFLKLNKGGVCGSSIKWNFTKFLVDGDGHVIKRYGTSTPPMAIAVGRPLSLSFSLSLSLAYLNNTSSHIVLQGDIRKALGETLGET